MAGNVFDQFDAPAAPTAIAPPAVAPPVDRPHAAPSSAISEEDYQRGLLGIVSQHLPEADTIAQTNAFAIANGRPAPYDPRDAATPATAIPATMAATPPAKNPFDQFDAVAPPAAPAPPPAKPDTLSGLTPEAIKAKFDALPEGLRPGLTDLNQHGYSAGLDTEVYPVAKAAAAMLLHPDEAIRSQGQNIVDAYHEGRTNALAAIDYAKMQHPDLAPVAEIAGAVANPLGAEAKGFQGALRAGALYGGVSGFEDNNGSLEDRLGSAGKSAAISAVAAPALVGASHALIGGAGKVKSVLAGDPMLARKIVAKAISADGNTGAQVATNMADAQANGVPYMLADSGDNARGMLAASVRAPGPARTAARNALQTRQDNLSGRVQSAIETHLGPVANPHQIADTLMTKARNESGPLYHAFNANQPVSNPALDALIRRPSMKAAMNKAYRIAAEEGRVPESLGLVRDEDGNVVFKGSPASQSDIERNAADRYRQPEQSDEYKELSTRNVRTKNGKIVPMKGPLDITQLLRVMGGVHDAGGTLAHMGITNAPRRMAFGSNENFLGNLIDNEHGMPLDEATLRAWEAGHMPEFSERPEIEDLLDRLHQEHIGANRFFHPDDAEEAERFEQAQSSRYAADEAHHNGMVEDISASAGPRPGTQWTPKTALTYSPQTLDYMKRGLDDVVEAYRDSTTGKLNLDTEGNAINNTRASLLKIADKMYPNYKAARDAYGGPLQGIAAMNAGRKALNLTGDDLEARMRDMTPYQKNMYALGVRRAMAEAVDSKGDTANVVGTLVGTGKKRAMLGRLFGDRPGFDNFVNTLKQEQEGFHTYKRAALGSMTGQNKADDGGLNSAMLVSDLLSTGLPIRTVTTQAMKFATTKMGDKTRLDVARMLSDTDPVRLSALADTIKQEQLRRAKLGGTINRGAILGERAVASGMRSTSRDRSSN